MVVVTGDWVCMVHVLFFIRTHDFSQPVGGRLEVFGIIEVFHFNLLEGLQ